MPGKHQHFQEPEVGCCGKYFLFGFNIVFWVSAGWVLGPVLGVAEGGGSVPFGAPPLGLSPPPPDCSPLGLAPIEAHHPKSRPLPTALY